MSCYSFFFICLFFFASLFCCKGDEAGKEDDTISSEEIQPLTTFYWVRDYLKDDQTKTLEGIKETVEAWEELENFVEDWGIESLGVYKMPTEKEKSHYLAKNFLKFADKKLSQHVKNKGDKNPTVVRVERVREVMHSNVELSLMHEFKLKFRARPFLGRAYFFMINPLVDWWTEVHINGPLEMKMQKDISFLGLKTEINYKINEKKWEASFRKEISLFLEGRISSVQRISNFAFTDESETKFELYYARPF